jgi:uncharacterized membrane protein YbhN (UPF0104 family)
MGGGRDVVLCHRQGVRTAAFMAALLTLTPGPAGWFDTYMAGLMTMLGTPPAEVLEAQIGARS